MELVERLECGCNPAHVYATRATFKAHANSNRHRAWIADQNRLVAETSETCVDILRRRLESSERKNDWLAGRVAELEAAIFGMHLKRAVSESKKKKVASAQAWRCACCTGMLSHVFEIDHVMPLFLGGNNAEENLQALCRECHGQKTALDKEAFRTRGGSPGSNDAL
jgi:hypothetical protein